ncbi:MAG: CBS domain-containing protein [Oligoflexia bacterium]|nr:CBS domain-containing protein [Oligoflexia bacterium]
MLTQVKYLSSKNLIVAKWDESLDEAYCKMRKHNIRHLPVVSDTGHVLGVISDRDFQRAMQNDGHERFYFKDDDTVREFMTWPAKFIDERVGLSQVCEIMINDKLSSLLITKADEVTGIVTSEDLLKVLQKYFKEQEGSKLEGVKSYLYSSPVGEIAHLLSASGI